MLTLLKDSRAQRLLLANITGSIGSGVTIIAIPWLLVQQPGGDQLYGWATLGTTIALFLFMPYYGAWIDRHSRKRMLLIGELFGLTATSAMGVWALLSGELHTWQLVVSYFCGMLYYTLHYPAKFAFVQQVFDRSQYQSLTGILEVQGQAASAAAGFLGGVFIGHYPLHVILFLDAATYLVSFAVQSTIPYVATHLGSDRPPAKGSAWHAMAEGWRWLRERPQLTMFFLCTYAPFIAVMVGNYLFPIYVSQVLGESSRVFANGEMGFAVGAILAGLLLPKLATTHGADKTVVVTMALFIVGLAMLAATRHTWAFYAALLLLGLGNAGSRVARSAIVLTLVPNAVMGRVNIFFAAFDRLLRTVLTFAATLIVAHKSPALGFGLLFVFIGIAFAGMLSSRHTVRRSPVPAPAAA